MENIRKRAYHSGLRRSFVLYVLVTLAAAAGLSGLVIWGCVSVQSYMLPDPNAVFLNIEKTYADGSGTATSVRMPLDGAEIALPELAYGNGSGINMETGNGGNAENGTDAGTEEGGAYTETDSSGENVRYSVSAVTASIDSLTPRRKLVYRGSQIGMVALPAAFSLGGILLCGFAFYRRKLKTPILLLSSAAEQIARQNLDFRISYKSGDEMEALCTSFEQMRRTLRENNRKLWEMVEERRRLQSSVAHDLRNPIAIIRGYAQYLQMQLSRDEINREKIDDLADNILETSRRLERYTDSLRTISRLEELEIRPVSLDFSELSSDMKNDFLLLTKEKNLELVWKNNISEKDVVLDAQVLYRILENLIGNALRFAGERIEVMFSWENGFLAVTVADDGAGFPEQMLKEGEAYAGTGSDREHMGIGLMICRILCRKHGGKLWLSNSGQGGGVVRVILAEGKYSGLSAGSRTGENTLTEI